MQTETKMTTEVFYSRKFARNLGYNISRRLHGVLCIFAALDSHRLLDIGCGDGSISSLLKNSCDEIYGVDIADEAVKSAIKRGIKAIRVNVDAEDLPFQSEFFDAIFCGEIIEHLYDPDHLLDEIHRILVPRGICVITTPNLASWLNRIVLLFGFQPYLTEVSLKHNVGKFRVREEDVSGHIRVFAYRSLKGLLELHGFKIERAFGISIAKDLPFLVKPFEKLFSKRASLASYLVFVMRKDKSP